MQLFCQEEFLRRLEQSNYANNFILKGGLFLYSLTEFDSRVTVDIDFLIEKISNTPESLQKIVEDIIIEKTENDFIEFEIKKTSSVSITKKYSGVNVSLVAKINNTRTPVSIDFGFGDVIVPNHKKRRIPTQLDDFKAPLINTYSIETTIAEKTDAIFSLMEFSSRMKDYYDIYYLLHKFDFDGKILCEALSRTFKNRNRQFTSVQLQKVVAFHFDKNMCKKWQAFCRKINIDDEFSAVLNSISTFLEKPLYALLNGDDFKKTWDSNSCTWN